VKSRTIVIIVLIVALPLAFAKWCTSQDDRLQANFAKISIGMSPDQVTAVMGRPLWDGKCRGVLPYAPSHDCAREFGYRVTNPIDPSYYLVWFGPNGRVIDFGPIHSP
jgi:hypothetical protein